MPAAIKLEDGHAFLDSAPPDQPPLTSPEATVLALTSIGMSDYSIGQRLERWYGERTCVTAVDTLAEKLDKTGMSTKEAVVATAFERGFLLPEKAPRSWIDPALRRDFFHLTALLGADYTVREIAEELDFPIGEIQSTLGCIALDLDFDFMERPTAAFVTLAAMARLLPFNRKGPVAELMPPLTSRHEQLLQGHTLDFYPYGVDSDFTVRFTDQSIKRTEPDMTQGSIDQISIDNTVIEVCDDIFMGNDNKAELLTTPELKLLVLKSVGVPEKTILETLDISAYTVGSLYGKLLPDARRTRQRTMEQVIFSAFAKGIFVPKGRPALHLDQHWSKRFFDMTTMAANGLTNKEMAAKLNVSTGGANYISCRLQKMLGVRGIAPLVLMSMAHQFYKRPQPTSPVPPVVQLQAAA
jgi:DNA-binding NarL/FixJ family response regulator